MLKSYTSVLEEKHKRAAVLKRSSLKKNLVYVLKALNKGRYILRRLYKLNSANYLIQWGFFINIFPTNTYMHFD